MYRRYCDDIIIVLPMTQEDVKGKMRRLLNLFTVPEMAFLI